MSLSVWKSAPSKFDAISLTFNFVVGGASQFQTYLYHLISIPGISRSISAIFLPGPARAIAITLKNFVAKLSMISAAPGLQRFCFTAGPRRFIHFDLGTLHHQSCSQANKRWTNGSHMPAWKMGWDGFPPKYQSWAIKTWFKKKRTSGSKWHHIKSAKKNRNIKISWDVPGKCTSCCLSLPGFVPTLETPKFPVSLIWYYRVLSATLGRPQPWT